MGQVADLLRRFLPHLFRIALYVAAALVIWALLVALAEVALGLLRQPLGFVLIGLLWLWIRRGRRLL